MSLGVTASAKTSHGSPQVVMRQAQSTNARIGTRALRSVPVAPNKGWFFETAGPGVPSSPHHYLFKPANQFHPESEVVPVFGYVAGKGFFSGQIVGRLPPP